MKHPHAELIKQWLEDTTQDIEIFVDKTNKWCGSINYADYFINDVNGLYKFRIKPKPDKYEHLRKAAKEGKKIQEWQEHIGQWITHNIVDGTIFLFDSDKYRIIDEYEHLRQAIRDGKKIEYLYPDKNWRVVEYKENVLFTDKVDSYRIHDPYRELKEAQEQGKRVVFKHLSGEWKDCSFGGKFDFDAPAERYKIVEDDIVEHADIMMLNERNPVRIKITKSGIDGTITAEVINDNSN